MAVKDIQDSSLAVTAIAPVTVSDNTPQVSAIIKADFFALEFFTSIGTIADADATFAVTIEDGNESDLSDAAPVTAQFLAGTLANAGFQFDSDNQTRQIGYVGKKQYVRYTVTPSGNTGAATFCVLAVKAISGTVPHS